MVEEESLVMDFSNFEHGYDCRSIAEVYHDKVNWKCLNDNHKFLFNDSLVAVLKRVVLRDTYKSRHVVESIDDLKYVSTDVESPCTVSVIQPYMVIPTYGKDVYNLLDSSDCANIVKVAKFDFTTGDNIIGDNFNTKYSFSFGQRAEDTQTKEIVVLVGQTRKFAYILSESSITRDGRMQIAFKPRQRNLKFLKMVFPLHKALNFTVVQECAKMEEYIIQFSERSYTSPMDTTSQPMRVNV